MMRTTFLLAVLPALALSKDLIPDGPRGVGTEFSACGGFLFGGKNRCYSVIISKINIVTGDDGTKDSVTAKICSKDGKTCCETGKLSSLGKNENESYTESKFDKCKNKPIPVQNGTVQVTLNRKGSDSLVVKKLFIEAKSVSSDKKKALTDNERFECPSFALGTTTSASQVCQTSPYVYHRVKKLSVVIGKDGTNDNVKVDICSNINNVCCKTKLSSALSDDWSSNDNEVWEEKHFGDCKTMLYKGSSSKSPNAAGLRVTVSKDGKDDIGINKITLETEDTYGQSYKYDCGAYKLVSDGFPCLEGVNCAQSSVCRISGKPTIGSSLAPRKPSSASIRPKATTARPKSTTKRPPFRTG